MRKTEDVKLLVESALDAMPKPITAYVIGDVFRLIALDAQRRAEDDALCAMLGKRTVNQMGAKWIAMHVAGIGHGKVAVENGLIRSHALL